MKYDRAGPLLFKRIGLDARLGALVLVVLISLMSGTARAEDDDDSIWNFDKKVLGWMFSGLGPRHKADDPYIYRERPPLVVPPSRGLPPPQTSAVALDPNWPVDPSIDRRREAAEKRKAARQDSDPDQFTNPLPPSELRAGGSAASVAQNRAARGTDMTDTMPPSQLGSSRGFFGSLFAGTNDQQEQQVGAVAVEPSRRSLTDPPPGYQIPSPNHPYGVTPRDKPTRHEDLAVGDEGL